ncbi:MAG: single-stranded-DNA-specific exonuclease RecJ [Patescibacteria group bacterium]
MKQYTIREDISKADREKLIEHSDIVAQLLHHRGIRTKEDADVFLSPEYTKGNHDPFLMNDMEKAVERILDAVESHEKICIYSDYDADGIPGAVVLHDLFKKIGYENFINYIPDRSEEGFGLNQKALSFIAEQNAKLLITVDCGIAEIENTAFANTLGMDVIITDHHNLGEILPKSFAIVNPKIGLYPEKMLCGAGVAYKLAQAILLKKDFGIKSGEEKWLLDMVGIATLSDMVPLLGENRVLASFGLVVLRKSRRIGLQKLLRKLKIDQRRLTEDDVGFMISPRINAASRMGVSYDAFKLLTTTDELEADMLVDKLEKVNKERKGTTAFLVKEVKKHIEAKYSPYFQNKIIVAGDPSWKPSLLGLVANSLAESESKPVFLWGRDGAQSALKGSCRSVGNISVTDLMTAVAPGIFTESGGHHLAGGFAVSYDTVHLLEDELARVYEKFAHEAFAPDASLDASIKIDDVNNIFVRDIERLAPFGTGNPKPIFLISDAPVYSVSMFGKTKEHLKIVLTKSNGAPLEAISFFASEKLFEKSQNKSTISIVGNIERSFFLGRESLRIRIEDII